jgi:hypothetical protein
MNQVLADALAPGIQLGGTGARIPELAAVLGDPSADGQLTFRQRADPAADGFRGYNAGMTGADTVPGPSPRLRFRTPPRRTPAAGRST